MWRGRPCAGRLGRGGGGCRSLRRRRWMGRGECGMRLGGGHSFGGFWSCKGVFRGWGLRGAGLGWWLGVAVLVFVRICWRVGGRWLGWFFATILLGSLGGWG